MTIYDPSLPDTIYKPHDPTRTICPSTKKTCHNLVGCRFTSCHYWNGYSLIRAAEPPTQAVMVLEMKRPASR